VGNALKVLSTRLRFQGSRALRGSSGNLRQMGPHNASLASHWTSERSSAVVPTLTSLCNSTRRRATMSPLSSPCARRRPRDNLAAGGASGAWIEADCRSAADPKSAANCGMPGRPLCTAASPLPRQRGRLRERSEKRATASGAAAARRAGVRSPTHRSPRHTTHARAHPPLATAARRSAAALTHAHRSQNLSQTVVCSLVRFLLRASHRPPPCLAARSRRRRMLRRSNSCGKLRHARMPAAPADAPSCLCRRPDRRAIGRAHRRVHQAQSPAAT
jgi:hypothetical protein